MQLSISFLEGSGVASAPVEVVERKGIGHPDTVCDALVEELSRSLSRFYLERFGHILHHNVDKGLLFGGVSQPAFGGGRVLAPMEIHLTGRATLEFRGITVPIEELAIENSRQWLQPHRPPHPRARHRGRSRATRAGCRAAPLHSRGHHARATRPGGWTLARLARDGSAGLLRPGGTEMEHLEQPSARFSGRSRVAKVAGRQRAALSRRCQQAVRSVCPKPFE